MKFRFIFPLICAIMIGFLFGKIMFNQYDTSAKVTTVFSEKKEKAYFIQQGVYSSLDSMKKNVASFSSYIYEQADDKYYVYIGITKSKDNLSKLKGYFKDMGYTIYVKEFTLENKEFLDALSQYDELLSKTDDTASIKTIENQVLEKYGELVQDNKSSN